MRLQHLAYATAFALIGFGTAIAEENRIGAESFATHCVACHGDTGAGNGEFADVLTVEPADLTTLTTRNNGEFPYLGVLRTIDGRTVLRGHSIMPLWGDVFKREIGDTAGPYGAELLIRARMIALVDYVETLQK